MDAYSYCKYRYPDELEIKDTTECSTYASYLDVLLKLDTDGKILTQLFDKLMISISPSSTSLTYVVIFQLQLHVVYIYGNLFDM